MPKQGPKNQNAESSSLYYIADTLLKIVVVIALIIFIPIRSLYVFLFREEGLLFRPALNLLEFISHKTDKVKSRLEEKVVSKVFFTISILAILLLPFDLISLWVLLFLIAMSALVIFLGFKYTPFEIMLFIVDRAIRFVYELDFKGTENIPKEGPGILISNHISFIDFAIIAAISPRNIYFIMDYQIYSIPFVKWFCDRAFTIPIDNRKNPQIKEAAFRKIKRVLKRGEMVLIFPEGQVSYDGYLDFFRRGLVRIQKENVGVPIIPMTIKGLEGGYFSRVGKLFNPQKIHKEMFRKVSINIGPPVPSGQMDLKELENLIRHMLDEVQDIIEEEEIT